MSPPLELMVVKYVAEVHGDWSSFRVFTTGRPDTYLFDQIDRWGCSVSGATRPTSYQEAHALTPATSKRPETT